MFLKIDDHLLPSAQRIKLSLKSFTCLPWDIYSSFQILQFKPFAGSNTKFLLTNNIKYGTSV